MSRQRSPTMAGSGGQRVPAQHRRRPLQHVRADAAAVVVDVVGVAVVGRAQRDDRLQRRRAVGGDLQRVEPAPRDADHADRAGAPRLLGDPGDHLARVGLLLRAGTRPRGSRPTRRCRAGRPARRRSRGRRGRGSGASRAPPCRRSGGRAGTRGSPAPGRCVGVLGQPDPRGQAAAVGERRSTPSRSSARRAWKLGDDAHRRHLSRPRPRVRPRDGGREPPRANHPARGLADRLARSVRVDLHPYAHRDGGASLICARPDGRPPPGGRGGGVALRARGPPPSAR